MSEAGRRALVVVNPQSGGAKKAAAYLEPLADAGMILVRRECHRRSNMAELIRSMQHEVDCVVLAGGGGTLSAAAIALRDTGLPLGILPLGEDNHLARTLGLPLDPEGAANVILAGVTHTVDVGSVNGQPFFSVATIGLTIEQCRRLNQATTSRVAPVAYLGAALRTVFGSRRFSAIIRSGATIYRVRTLQIAIGNGHLWYGGMPAIPRPGSDDHLIEVYSLEPENKWRILFMPGAFGDNAPTTGEHVRSVRGPVIEVVTRLPQPIIADGESITVTPARFSVLHDAVHVYVPAAPPTTPQHDEVPQTESA